MSSLSLTSEQVARPERFAKPNGWADCSTSIIAPPRNVLITQKKPRLRARSKYGPLASAASRPLPLLTLD